MYIYVCVYIYIYIYIYTHTYIYLAPYRFIILSGKANSKCKAASMAGLNPGHRVLQPKKMTEKKCFDQLERKRASNQSSKNGMKMCGFSIFISLYLFFLSFFLLLFFFSSFLFFFIFFFFLFLFLFLFFLEEGQSTQGSFFFKDKQEMNGDI